MHRFIVLFIFISMFSFGIISCSGSGAPSAPEVNLTNKPAGQNSSSGRVLWGMWHITLNPETETAEIVPLRTAEVGVNVTRFMHPPVSPVHMIILTFDSGASDYANGKFVLNVTLKHPFPGLAMYRGFDVRGIFMSDGDAALTGDGNLLYASDAASHMLNPDGYTRWWNSTEFPQPGLFGFTPGKLAPPTKPSAILNPYKYFCDDLSAESPLSDVTLEKRGTFGTKPGANTRKYEIQFKMDGPKVIFDFNYAVDASWEDLGPGATSYEVDDFPLSANCNEAWWVELDTTNSTLYYVSNTNKGGQLIADVTIHDWQAIDPSGDISDEISGINLHSQIFNSGMIEMISAGANLIDAGTGWGIWRLKLDAVDLNLLASGKFDIWVEALSSDPDTYAPQIAGGESIPHAEGTLAAYNKGSIYVSDLSPQKPPIVTEVIPKSGIKGKTLDNVQIIGSNFIAASLEVEFKDGSYSIPVSDVTFVSDTKVTCDLNLTSAEIGFYDVYVRVDNLNGPGLLEGVLNDGFEVVEQTPYWGWPILGRNRIGNYLANFKGPQTSNLVYSVNSTVATSPEALFVGVDPDNPGDWLVYIGYYSSGAKAFSAYRASNGSQKWSVNAPSPYTYLRLFAVAPPNVPCPNNESGTVYVWATGAGSGYQEKIIALSAKDGSTLWEYTATSPGSWLQLERYGTVDSNGDLIFCNAEANGHWMRCLNYQDGSVKWVISTGFHQTPDPVFSPDEKTIYIFSNSSNTLRAFNLTANPPSQKWSLFLGTYCPAEHQSSPIVASDGSIYVMGRTNILVKVQDNGTSGSIVWTQSGASGGQSAWLQLAEGPDGSIYALVPGCTLYRYHPATGAILNQSATFTADYYTGMAIGSDGLIYIGGRGAIWCYNPDCSVKWSVSAPGSRCTDAALLDDGSLFVADIANGKLYKFHD